MARAGCVMAGDAYALAQSPWARLAESAGQIHRITSAAESSSSAETVEDDEDMNADVKPVQPAPRPTSERRRAGRISVIEASVAEASRGGDDIASHLRPADAPATRHPGAGPSPTTSRADAARGIPGGTNPRCTSRPAT